MFFREAPQLGQPCHRAVVAHDLADDPHWPAAGEAREIDRRLRVAGTLQHSAALRAQWEDVSRLDEVIGD